MNINSNLKINMQAKEMSVVSGNTLNVEKKEAKIATGYKIKDTVYEAVDVSLSDKVRKQSLDEIIQENIMSMTCDIHDVVMADEMIRAANHRILEKADESIIVQSEQSVDIAMELLR